MKRLFFAYDIDSSLRDAVGARAGDLRKELGELSSAVRFVDARNYHMTVAFLGDTSEEKLTVLRSALESVSPLRGSRLSLGPPLVFPRPRDPRVLVLSLKSGKEPLLEIAESLRSTLRSLSVDFDTKPFRPHLTVGYLRRRPRKVQRTVADIWLKKNSSGERGAVTAITLYESTLTQERPRYAALASRTIELQT